MPVSHSHAIVEGLTVNNDNERIDFYQIEGYNHQNAPSFLLSHEASKLMRDFLKKVLIESRKDPSGSEYEWEKYHKNSLL